MQNHKEQRVEKTNCLKLSLLITNFHLLTTPLILSGCMGVYEGGFECPPGEGVGCKSISEVNHLINDGQLPKEPLSSSQGSSCRRCRPSENKIQQPHIWFAPQEFVTDLGVLVEA
ncbi:MAG: hypothetical protein JSR85_06595 [Proteobacteria bacterium]|nr:hypothetical protein [Pseudomonadota bacterium]